MTHLKVLQTGMKGTASTWLPLKRCVPAVFMIIMVMGKHRTCMRNNAKCNQICKKTSGSGHKTRRIRPRWNEKLCLKVYTRFKNFPVVDGVDSARVENIEHNVILNLCQSKPSRVQAIINARGELHDINDKLFFPIHILSAVYNIW